jgi:hypothetical protein
MPAGIDLIPTNTPPLDVDFPMRPRHFNPSDPYLNPTTSEPVFAPSTTAEKYQGNGQFGTFATFGSTAFPVIHSNMDVFNPHCSKQNFATSIASTSHKRHPTPLPQHDERSKRQKVDEYSGGEMLPSSRDPSIGLQLSNQRQTSAVTPPVAVFSLDRPEGMPKDDYVRALQAKLNAECPER